MGTLNISISDALELRSQKVGDWCKIETKSQPMSLPPCASIAEVIEHFALVDEAAVVVREGSQVLGIISERDVLNHLTRNGYSDKSLNAERIMSRDVKTISSDQACVEAVSIMVKCRIRHLPVVDDGIFIGLLSIIDAAMGQICQSQTLASSVLTCLSSIDSPIHVVDPGCPVSEVLKYPNWGYGIFVDTGGSSYSFISGAELSRLVVRSKENLEK